MESRNDVLRSAADRQSRIIFHSSTAVGIVMSIVVLGAVITARPAAEHSQATSLSAAEAAAAATEARVEAVAPAAGPTARIGAVPDAEFEFPPHYVTAPAF
jgi:hypothetical protein